MFWLKKYKKSIFDYILLSRGTLFHFQGLSFVYTCYISTLPVIGLQENYNAKSVVVMLYM